MKVLHIADPHWDPEYLEGSNAKCGDPLCCRASSGTVKDPADSAGYWGDYRSCDMPWRTLESAVAHMAEHHNVSLYLESIKRNKKKYLFSRSNIGCCLHSMDR